MNRMYNKAVSKKRDARTSRGAVGREGTRRVAAEACSRLLNSSRKVSSTAPSLPDARHFISIRPRRRTPIALAGARRSGQTALQLLKIWALQVVRSAAAGWRMAPPKGAECGGQDGLVLLAGAERTAASCSAAPRGSFCTFSDLQLQRIDELRFKHSSRAYTMLLSRGMDW